MKLHNIVKFVMIIRIPAWEASILYELETENTWKIMKNLTAHGVHNNIIYNIVS